jgi:hypothetical protein
MFGPKVRLSSTGSDQRHQYKHTVAETMLIALESTQSRELATFEDMAQKYIMPSRASRPKRPRDLKCERLQADEAWSFCYAKQRNVTRSALRPE